jgi:cell shape-determining protein MreD
MNWLDTIFVLFAAFIGVFWEAAFHGLRHVLGAQIDLLPPLMVYAGLSTSLNTALLLALCGGLWFDSLSANPLGISVLPLVFAGAAIYACRELILRNQTFARLIMGLVASVAVPLFTIVLLLSTGHHPLLGWGTLWQLLVMGLGGAFVTPIFFEVFGWLHRKLGRVTVHEVSFRPDREIRRGK